MKNRTNVLKSRTKNGEEMADKSVKSTLQSKKPRDLMFGADYIASVCESYHYDGRDTEEGIDLLNRSFCTKEARKVAKWLNSACDYLEPISVNTSNKRGKTNG
jgi:hypothetical protein